MSTDMLALAGITSLAQLKRMGSVAAYAKTKKLSPRASLNLLWGLESALTGEPWQRVAQQHRASLLLALEAYEAGMEDASARAKLRKTPFGAPPRGKMPQETRQS